MQVVMALTILPPVVADIRFFPLSFFRKKETLIYAKIDIYIRKETCVYEKTLVMRFAKKERMAPPEKHRLCVLFCDTC